MDMKSTDPVSEQQPTARESPFGHAPVDWRVFLATAITFLWLILIGWYVSRSIGWANIASAPMEIVGTFLEGAFAPLAFLWLVVGYFLQKKELMQNTDAIKMQYVEIQKSADQAVIQSEAIRAQEVHSRRQSFLQIAESVKQQLGAIAAFLFLSSQGATSSGVVTEERIGELWGSLNNTDPEGFSRSMLQLRFQQGTNYAFKLLYGTPIRTRHCENFIFNFERLLKAAEDSDADFMIRDALMGSAHGRLYLWMIDYRENPPPGFTYGVYDFDPDTIE